MSLGHDFAPVLAAAKAGAEWAVALLYRDLQPRILGYLQGQEPADAEDLASEVWAAAARALARFEGDETHFHRWLFTIARRKLIDHRRSRLRPGFVSLGQLPETADPVETVRDPVDKTASERLLAHLATLPADQAEVILLRVVAEFDVADVAAILDKKPGTIRVLQHRALERLADRLASDPSFVTR